MAQQKTVQTALDDFARTHGVYGVQQEVARRLGVTRQTIRNWTRANSVPLRKLQAFAKLTGAKPEDLNADLRRFSGRSTR